MKISTRWLADYVDIDDLEPDRLAERLTLATAEVEDVTRVVFSSGDLVVARIVDVSLLPGSADARVLRLDVGGGREVSTVSTAPGLRPGMHVVHAPPGAVVGGRLLRTESLGGAVSQGMICGAADLGWGSLHEQALELPGSLVPGMALSTLVPPDDHILEIDNKGLTHRPDLWGHYGLAREVAAILERPLRELPVADLQGAADLDPYPVTVDDPEACPAFSCLAVDVDPVRASPPLVQQRLHVLGLRSLGPVVDATNYVLLDLAQPTHIYDRDHVAGLRVARAGAVAEFVTLDGVRRRLVPADLLVLSGADPIGLAGIMGGEDSGVTSGTSRLLLESANFNAVDVRRTSVRLGLRTDASQRYEKGQPPRNAPWGLARLLRVLSDAGLSPRPVSRSTVVGDLGPESWKVDLPADGIAALAGAPIADEVVTRILHNLGLRTERREGRLVVTVPAFRSRADISLPEDVAEEVLRIHGFGRIEPVMPEISTRTVPVHPAVKRAHRTRAVLAAVHRMHEVECYPWFDDGWLSRLGMHPEATLRLRNPVAPAKARLRTALVPNLLKVASENLGYADDFAFFEIGHVFVPGAAEGRRSSDAGHSEQQRLAGVRVTASRGEDAEQQLVLDAVAALQDVSEAVTGVPVVATPFVAESVAPWQAAGAWSELRHGGRLVGALGLLVGDVAATVTKGRRCVWFEVDLEQLPMQAAATVAYEPVPVVPASRQDFAVLWPARRPYAELQAVLDRFAHPLVTRREHVDVFVGDALDPGVASHTVRFWLQLPDRTLTPSDITGFRDDLVQHLGQEGLQLR
jgi:phenylalanyl-tRNA synthetase beta chain